MVAADTRASRGPVTGFLGCALALVIAALWSLGVSLSNAHAARVAVLHPDGRASMRNDGALHEPAVTPQIGSRSVNTAWLAARPAADRTVRSELTRLYR